MPDRLSIAALAPIAFAIALALTGCTLIFDTGECDCDEDCEKYEGTPRCRNNVCVRGPTIVPLPDTTSPPDVTDTAQDDTGDLDDTDLDDLEVADAELDGDDLDTADGDLDDADATTPTLLVVDDDIREDTVWTADHIYVLERPIFVTINATLTIEAGTTILGTRPAPDPQDPLSLVGGTLVVTRGARLVTDGRRDAPVVFTSGEPAGMRAAGDWGGVVLLGRAPVNVAGGSAAVEGLPDTVNLQNRSYGGLEPADSCGQLRYTRIEFAGYELAPGSELNGLTLAGCGSQTVVRNVQVHRALDDGIELFGGTAPLRNVVVSQVIDDGLDWDQGWSGSAQFVVVYQGGLGDKAIEADHSTVDPTLSITPPLVYNATLVGNGLGGVKLRRGATATFVNAVIAGQRTGLDIEGPVSLARFVDGEGDVRTSVFYDHDTPRSVGGLEPCAVYVDHTACLGACDPPDDGVCIDSCRSTTQQRYPATFAGLSATEIEAYFDTLTEPHPRCAELVGVDLDALLADAARDNLLETDPGLADPDSPTGLYPVTTDSPLLGGATPPDFDRQGNEFAPSATWIGAFEPADDTTWLEGWTDFSPN